MAEVKQYINLKPDPSKKRHGRIVKIKTKIDVKKPRKVHLFLDPGGKNHDAKKLRVGDRAGIAAPNAKHVGTLTQKDGTLEFDLVLSCYGGDKFTVKVSRDKAQKKIVKATDVYIVWRKLYYQVSAMKPSFPISFGKVKGVYQKRFIELEKTSLKPCPHKENLETHELKKYRHYFKRVKSPFEAHVVFIDRQCDSESRAIADTLTTPQRFYPYAPADRNWPFADWLTAASWSTPLTGPTSGGYTVKRAVVGGKRGILVDVSPLGGDPSTDPVMIDFEYKVLKGEYTGDATYKPHVFIAVGKPRSDASISKTIAHEIGHGVGMVPLVGHNLQYDNANGGMGSHCRSGAKPNRKSKAKGGAFAGEYAGGACVMFAYSSEHYGYCSTCDPCVQGAHLFAADMTGRGW